MLRFLVSGHMPCDFQAFHQTFFEESRALLDGALAIIAKGARAELDAGQIAELHRCVHGVAGGAATLGFEQPAALARALEERLDRYRTGGERPDSATIAHCAEALSMLLEMLAGLRAGATHHSGLIEPMIARLGAEPERPAGYRRAGLVRNRCSIRFVLSRSLAGADIIIEHVLEDLGRLGRIARVQAPSEGASRNWCIELESRAESASLIDVLDQIAEPGSVRIDRDNDRDHESDRAWADGPPGGPHSPEPTAGASAMADRPPRQSDLTSPPSPAHPADPATTAHEHFSFRVGDQWFAVAASRVLGVAPYRGEFRMPGVPEVLLGMLAVDGEPIPLVDARLALGLDASAAGPDDAVRVVLIDTYEGPIGLLADGIGDRLESRPEALKRPRALLGMVAGSPVIGFVFMQEEVFGVLDPDRLCAFLADVDVGPRPASASGGNAGIAATGPRPDRAMMQDGVSSAIMAKGKDSRMQARRATTRPVVRRSLEEEWEQRDP